MRKLRLTPEEVRRLTDVVEEFHREDQRLVEMMRKAYKPVSPSAGLSDSSTVTKIGTDQ